ALMELRERSLILAEDRQEERHFRMLETLREYALEQLSTEAQAVSARRQRDYFLQLAEGALPESHPPNTAHWFDRMEAEFDNLRAALDWCEAVEGEARTGLRLAV